MTEKLLQHPVFATSIEIHQYYDLLSFGVMGTGQIGVVGIVNLDSYMFDSLESGMKSVNLLLQNGRINDAYMLLRKYYDNVVVNIYAAIQFRKSSERMELVAEVIDGWVKGKTPLPKYEAMIKDIYAEKTLKIITGDPDFRKRLVKVRRRCEDHVHTNFFQYSQFNNEIDLQALATKVLDLFDSDLKSIFAMHQLLLFRMTPYYMSSSDYIDCLEAGIEPPEDSQYLVAPFIQSAFDKYVKPWNGSLAETFRANCYMKVT